MYRLLGFVSVVLWLQLPAFAPAAAPVPATVETTLTRTDDHIRMLAFDADPISSQRRTPAQRITSRSGSTSLLP
jgi:hypothetical protein